LCDDNEWDKAVKQLRKADLDLGESVKTLWSKIAGRFWSPIRQDARQGYEFLGAMFRKFAFIAHNPKYLPQLFGIHYDQFCLKHNHPRVSDFLAKERLVNTCMLFLKLAEREYGNNGHFTISLGRRQKNIKN
jgi:hypothetical protein